MLLRNALGPPSSRREWRDPAGGGRGRQVQVSDSEHSERPWGYYTCSTTMHRITRSSAWSFTPADDFSYQRHAKRAEHWFIVAGTAAVTLDGVVTVPFSPGRFIDIPQEGAHRVANERRSRCGPHRSTSTQHLSSGEDDIVRLEDDFGRVPAP